MQALSPGLEVSPLGGLSAVRPLSPAGETPFSIGHPRSHASPLTVHNRKREALKLQGPPGDSIVCGLSPGHPDQGRMVYGQGEVGAQQVILKSV